MGENMEQSKADALAKKAKMLPVDNMKSFHKRKDQYQTRCMAATISRAGYCAGYAACQITSLLL